VPVNVQKAAMFCIFICHKTKDASEAPTLPHTLNWSKNDQY